MLSQKSDVPYFRQSYEINTVCCAEKKVKYLNVYVCPSLGPIDNKLYEKVEHPASFP